MSSAEAEELTLLRELHWRRRARRSLIEFTRYTNRAYEVAYFHERIAAALEAVERGEILRLLIQAPPRHGKTELASRHFPAWYLGQHPDRDIISASYGQDLAIDFSRDVRDIVRTREYQNVFPGVSLSQDSQAVNRWHVNGSITIDGHVRSLCGGYVAAGVGTAIVGRGAHLFNIDDPVKGRAEAESEVDRKANWNWYRSVAYTRLMPQGAVVLTLTRWHEEDLAGQILQQAGESGAQGVNALGFPTVGDWSVLTFPAINERGEALWAERYPLPVLRQIEQTVGEYDWNALYMQRPRPPGGSFFTEANLLLDGKPIASPPMCDCVFAVIDTALKTGREHDGLAVTYFAFGRHVHWDGQRDATRPWCVVLDWDLKQIQGALLEHWLPSVATRLEELARECKALFGSKGAFIEDKGSGTVLLQQAANRDARNEPGVPKLNAHAIDSKLTAMGKVGRAIGALEKAEKAISVSTYVERGDVKFAAHAYNKVVTYKGVTRNHLLSQVLNFRAGAAENNPDDALDTFTCGVAISLGNRGGF